MLEVFLLAGAGVAAVVYGLIFWSIFAYRKRGDGLPPQFRENLPLEVAYTTIPLIIVAVLFIFTYRTESFVDRIATTTDPVTIHVTGYQWSWRFTYDGTGVRIDGTPDHPPEAVVPTRTPIRFVLDSVDVMHAFWIPAFFFKRDAMPGLTNRFDITVERPGAYLGECAEFCGLDHARMTFTVRAVPPGEYQRWLQGGGERR